MVDIQDKYDGHLALFLLFFFSRSSFVVFF